MGGPTLMVIYDDFLVFISSVTFVVRRRERKRQNLETIRCHVPCILTGKNNKK